MSINAQRQSPTLSNVIALNTIVAGTITPSANYLVPGGNQRIAVDSLYMYCIVACKVSTIVITTFWQATYDGTNWFEVYPHTGAAPSAVAAAGTGTTVTTTYFQQFTGQPAAYKYVRGAVLNTVATGGSSDQVTMAYGWLKSQAIPI